MTDMPINEEDERLIEEIRTAANVLALLLQDANRRNLGLVITYEKSGAYWIEQKIVHSRGWGLPHPNRRTVD